MQSHRYDDRRVAGKVPRVLERRSARVAVHVAQPATLTPPHGGQRRTCETGRDHDIVLVEERLQMGPPAFTRVIARQATLLCEPSDGGMPANAWLQPRAVTELGIVIRPCGPPRDRGHPEPRGVRHPCRRRVM